jgi:hypothetical protein
MFPPLSAPFPPFPLASDPLWTLVVPPVYLHPYPHASRSTLTPTTTPDDLYSIPWSRSRDPGYDFACPREPAFEGRWPAVATGALGFTSTSRIYEYPIRIVFISSIYTAVPFPIRTSCVRLV